MSCIQKIIDDIITTIDVSERGSLLESRVSSELTGLSGKKIVDVLQRLTKTLVGAESCYLEVGVFQGKTLLSVAAANPGAVCYGVDDFSQFDIGGRNMSIIAERQCKLDIKNAHLINDDYERVMSHLSDYLGSRKIAVYFVDGPHDYRSQMTSLLFAINYLAKDCAIIVDDSNYAHVRRANRDFLLGHPEFKLIYHAYTAMHPELMSDVEKARAEKGWWNGINIIVRDPNNELRRSLPPVSDDRALYYNEHVVHSMRLGALALDAVNLLQAIRSPRRFFWGGAHLLRKLWRILRDTRSLSDHLNTFSKGLTSGEIVPFRQD